MPKIQHYYFNFRNIEQYGYIGKYTSVILKIKSQSEGQQKNSYLGGTDSGRNPTVFGLGGKGKGKVNNDMTRRKKFLLGVSELRTDSL